MRAESSSQSLAGSLNGVNHEQEGASGEKQVEPQRWVLLHSSLSSECDSQGNEHDLALDEGINI